jgi:hypothetical protein
VTAPDTYYWRSGARSAVELDSCANRRLRATYAPARGNKYFLAFGSSKRFAAAVVSLGSL